jgi:hypothetical protein
MSSFVVFDIETGPLPDEQLKAVTPVFDRESIAHPGEWSPLSVKVGNLTDQAKIQAKIEQARAAHAAEVASYADRVEAAEKAYWSDVKSKAALSALTGQVLAIGYKSEKGVTLDCVSGVRKESAILTAFWFQYERMRQSDRHLVGFNIREFDIPFIAQRSVINDIAVPKTLLAQNKWLDSIFVDLRDRWGFGGRPSGSLDAISRACGTGAKPEGLNGGMFHTLYANPETREQAIEYLENDLEMTFALASKILW